MYEITEDGRVILDPTAPNDRIALSVYLDLLRADQDKLDEMSGAEPEPNELDKLMGIPIEPRVYHLKCFNSFEDGAALRWINSTVDDYEWIKVVLKMKEREEHGATLST